MEAVIESPWATDSFGKGKDVSGSAWTNHHTRWIEYSSHQEESLSLFESESGEKIDYLDGLKKAIVSSKQILELGPNWDDAGSPPYEEETWKRAVEFLENHGEWFWQLHGSPMPVPNIDPGPDGSIDIHWKT